MSIQRYTNEPFGAFALCENGEYVLYTDYLSEVSQLTTKLGQYKATHATSVRLHDQNNELRFELADAYEQRNKALAERDALSQKLKLTEEELDEVHGKLDESEDFSSASLALILQHVGEVEIEDGDFVSITDLEQAIIRHNAERDAAVRDRDEAVEALKKWQELFCDSDMRPEDECHECYDFAEAALAKIKGSSS